MEHYRPGLSRRARTAETEVNRPIAALQELLQVAGQRTLVREDPCSGLKYTAVLGLGPRPQRRVRREPWLVRHHVALHVTDFVQTQRPPARVHCRPEEI